MGDEAPWVPLGLNEDEHHEFFTLVSGTPPHLLTALMSWLWEDVKGSSTVSGVCSTDFLIEFGNASHFDTGVVRSSYMDVVNLDEHIRKQFGARRLLALIDFRISKTYKLTSPAASKLERVLSAGGSRWGVGYRGSRIGLVERLPEGVQQVVEAVLSGPHLASAKLKEAWGKAYGINPSPGDAYAAAVKAVEIVALGVVTPNDGEGTLGKVCKVMIDQKDWTLPIRDSAQAPAGETLIAMMRVLWRGQIDRHGKPVNYRDATEEEAKIAVLLASTLVGWFTSNVVERKNGAPLAALE